MFVINNDNKKVIVIYNDNRNFSPLVILARRTICTRAGISLKRTDFSEPQRGKDQADRDIAVVKSCLKAYTNRGGNLTNAESIKKAFDENLRSLHNCKTSVIAVEESKCFLPKIKIEGITKYHSIEFNNKSIIFWQYFRIGDGKLRKVAPCKCTLHARVIQTFSDNQNAHKEYLMRNTLSSVVLFCSVDLCSASFDNEEELIVHEQNGEHFYNDHCSLSTMDRARYLYIDHLKGARVLEEISNQAAIKAFQNLHNQHVSSKQHNDEFSEIFLSKGYAIRRRQKGTKITQAHQSFFMKLFYQGENTGKKVIVEKALQDMRSALKMDNTKQFSPNQYLTKNQIRSLFGRLARNKTRQVDNRCASNKQDREISTSIVTKRWQMIILE